MLAAALAAAPMAGAQDQPSALDTGIKAYQLGELSTAYKLLKSAEAMARTDEEKATGLIYLGMVYMAWDQKELAADSIAQAARLDPSRELDPTDFPPEVIETFTRFRPVGKGRIIVHAQPESAQVKVDGKPVGLGDGTPIELAPGRYQLSVTSEGYWTDSRYVEVVEHDSAQFVVELEKIIDPLQIRHAPVPFVHKNKPLELKARVSGGAAPLVVQVYIRPGGMEKFLVAQMTQEAEGTYTTALKVPTEADKVLEYYISAQDSKDSVSHSGAPDYPHSVSLLPSDSLPPSVIHNPVQTHSASDPLTLKFNVSDQSDLESVKLYYKRSDDSEYSLRQLEPLDNRGMYIHTIPGQFLDAEEIFYYILATDTAGNFRSLGSDEAPFVVRLLHKPIHSESQVTGREANNGVLGNKVTVGAGSLMGYEKGSTLFAINVVQSVSSPGKEPVDTQELAGEIVLKSVGGFTSEGDVAHEYYNGSVRVGSLVRLRPSPPGGLSAASDKFEAVRVAWAQSPEPEVKGYLVHRAEKLNGDYKVVAKVEGRHKVEVLDEGYKGFGLTGGVRYFYRVKAFNSSGALSNYSATTSAVVIGGPEPPTGLEGHSGLVRKIKLTWVPNQDPKVTGYRVFRSQSKEEEFELIDEIPSPTVAEYEDGARPEDMHPFEEGRVYWYKILSYDSLGRTGRKSEAVAAASKEKPAAPTGLRVESITPELAKLSWKATDNPEIAGYRLYRSASRDGVFEPVAQITGRWVDRYEDVSSPTNMLRPDMVYYYKLAAYTHLDAESYFSEVAVASMARPLDPPSHLHASTGLEGVIVLAWSPAEDPSVAGYHIYRGETPREAKVIASLAGRETSMFEDKGEGEGGLAPGAQYYYSVRSHTDQGVESQAGGWAKGATKAPPPPPKDIAATMNKNGEIHITWNVDAGLEHAGFRIFRSIDEGEFTELAVVAEYHYLDSEFFPGSRRKYKIQAIDLDGSAGPLSGVVFPSAKQPPAPPTGLFASPGMFSVALSWNPGREPDIRMYEVYMAQGEEWIKLGAFASPMALLEDLAADTEYQFAVKALDADGHGSLLSPPVKVRTLK